MAGFLPKLHFTHIEYNLFVELISLFNWDETTFLSNTEGSAIRRIGFERWQRNLAVGLGNAPYAQKIVTALQTALPDSTALVQEHITWAITQQRKKASTLGQSDKVERLNQRLIRSIEKGLPRDA